MTVIKECEVEEIFRLEGLESQIELVKESLQLRNRILLKQTPREELEKLLQKQPELKRVFQIVCYVSHRKCNV